MPLSVTHKKKTTRLSLAACGSPACDAIVNCLSDTVELSCPARCWIDSWRCEETAGRETEKSLVLWLLRLAANG